MGTGGARYGAGRPAYRLKAEQLMRVDVREWHRRGLLWVGGRNTWSWSRGSERVGSITFSVSEQAINLIYSLDGRNASQTIMRASTPCQRVSYSTQSGSESDRVHARYHKLHALVENGKPKWQRWAKFNRLEDRFDQADARANEMLWRVIQRLRA